MMDEVDRAYSNGTNGSLKQHRNGAQHDDVPAYKKTRMDPHLLMEEIANLKRSNTYLKEQLLRKQHGDPHVLSQGTTDVVTRPGDSPSFLGVFHNFKGGPSETPYEVTYIHPTTIKEDQRFEVRVDDLGNKWSKSDKKFDIGIGVVSANVKGGEHRLQYGFDLGCVSTDDRVLHLMPGEETEMEECSDGELVVGDILSFEVTREGVVARRNGKKSSEVWRDHHNADFEYQIFIGMNNRFQQVTLAYNTEFGTKSAAAMKNFPKKDLRICVATMNEGSPNYASGVSKGGTHLLSDGTLVRRLSEDNRRIINYQPGCVATTYDAKFGGHFVLSDILFDGLVRRRMEFAGNMVEVTRRGGHDRYRAHVKSIMTGYEQRFIGSDAQWLQQRDSLLSYGEKFLINIPTPFGQIGSSILKIAGTKCHTISNRVYDTLQHEVLEQDGVTKNTPALLLLGGDRLMSVGSIVGALRAYKDLCVVFFDAHFDFRDPHATEYPIAHGSPLFFLLQKNLREAINEWENKPKHEKEKDPNTKLAIKTLQETMEGKQYWDRLKDTDRGFSGFNWLSDTEEINPHRIAFTGVRQTEVEACSSLGSPLVTLFLNLLNLRKCMYTKKMIASEGVAKVFPKMIKQFRGTFEPRYLAIKDRECQMQNPGGDGQWIPPIFVSWDVDSIDPVDMPCCIFQEPNGLVAEECLALADEFANTKSMVAFETVEFNPDLWGGYRDEPIAWTINEFECGAHARAPREPADKNKHRLDRQHSTNLIQEMIVRAFDPTPKRVGSFGEE